MDKIDSVVDKLEASITKLTSQLGKGFDPSALLDLGSLLASIGEDILAAVIDGVAELLTDIVHLMGDLIAVILQAGDAGYEIHQVLIEMLSGN